MAKFHFPDPPPERDGYPSSISFNIRTDEDRELYDFIDRLNNEQGYPGRNGITRTLLMFAKQAYEEEEKKE